MKKAKVSIILFLLFCSLPFSAKSYSEEIYYFTVNEDTTALSLISTYLYGTCKKQIASWNKLKDSNKIYVGQKLILKEEPTLSEKEGRLALIQMWRNQFKLRGTRHVPHESRMPHTTLQEQRAIEKAVIEAKKEEKKSATPPATYKKEIKEAKKVFTNAEGAFNEGKMLLQKSKKRKAVEAFKQSRELDPKNAPAWLFELKTLKEMKEDDEFENVANEFLDIHPKFKRLPMFKDL